MNTLSLKRKRYIGDGVYAGFDGYQIWLWTSDGVEESAPIALEGPTLLALTKYASDLGQNAFHQGKTSTDQEQL